MKFYKNLAPMLMFFSLFTGIRHSFAAIDSSKYIPSVVQVLCTDTHGKHSFGSGFFIESGDIVTAYHVIQGATRIRVINHKKIPVTAKVKAYDASRDIAILSPTVKLMNSGQLKVGDVPASLSKLEGLVIGHPDQKENFAITVRFPKDLPMRASKWVGPIGTSGSSIFTFRDQDLELIAIDGTLNRGMSGGPLIVNDKVIGIFSGGEEASGGGLAWAIPLNRYLNTVTRNEKEFPASKLPKLTMLLDGGTPLNPLKRTTTKTAGSLLEANLEITERATELDQIFWNLDFTANLLNGVCRDNVNDSTLSSEIRENPWKVCATIFVNSTNPANSSALYTASLLKTGSLTAEYNKSYKKYNNVLEDELKYQMLTIMPSDIRRGYYRRLRSAVASCKFDDLGIRDDTMSNFQKSSSSVIAKLQAIWGRASANEFRGKADTFIDADVLSKDMKFRELVSEMIHSKKVFQNLRTELVTKPVDRFATCTNTLVQAFESKSAVASGNELPFDEFDLAEKLAVGTTVAIAYSFGDRYLSECSAQDTSWKQQLDDFHTAWRLKWFPYNRKAINLLKEDSSGNDLIAKINDIAEHQIQGFLGSLLSKFRMTCRNIASTGTWNDDPITSNDKVLGMVEMFGFSGSDLPKRDSEYIRLKSYFDVLLSVFLADSILKGNNFEELKMDNFITHIIIIATYNSIDQQVEQCVQWQPQLSKQLTKQNDIWKSKNLSQFEKSMAELNGLLVKIKSGNSDDIAQVREEIIGRLSDFSSQAAFSKHIKSSADSSKFCIGLSNRLGDLILDENLVSQAFH